MDLELDAPLPDVVFRVADDDPWTDRARGGVDLGLRQIEQVLALDITRAHVVADCETDDAPRRIRHQRELGFGNAPAGVASNPDGAAGRDDLLRERLEED